MKRKFTISLNSRLEMSKYVIAFLMVAGIGSLLIFRRATTR